MREKELEAVANILKTLTFLKTTLVLMERFMSAPSVFTIVMAMW
jgi:hypothetical protein